jgi:L-lactate dehydrogenase complex protein LldG
MSTRETILDAVRAALGRSAEPSAAAIDAEANRLLADLDAIRPALKNDDPVAAFAARITSPQVGATLDRIASLAELPDAVRRYLDGHALPHSLTILPDPTLQGLAWTGFELRTAAQPNEAASLGLAQWGIAETGTLVFHSGPHTSVLNHFLALHHLAAVRAGTILPHLEDYAAICGPAPRNVNLISGPSGTTDIEGSYVRGAHGPRFLHVIVVTA